MFMWGQSMRGGGGLFGGWIIVWRARDGRAETERSGRRDCDRHRGGRHRRRDGPGHRPRLDARTIGGFHRPPMTFDVGYDRPNYNPQWEVKAGQLIVVTMNNSGTMAHEFLLFSGDRGAILATVRYALALAESHNSGYQNDEAIGNATVDEYTGYHDSWANLSRVGCPESCVDHDVDPGNTFLFWFVVNTPGTYFFACHQVDRTDWKVHQDKGMWGTLTVTA